MTEWWRGLTRVLVALAIVVSIIGGTEAGAQEQHSITVMVGDRFPEGMMVSACLDGVERRGSATAVAASTEILVRGRSLGTVADAVAWRSVAPAPGCPGGVWAVVRLDVDDFAFEGYPDVPVNQWGEARVDLRVTLDDGPHAGELHVGSRQFTLTDGPPRGSISTQQATPDGWRITGYAVDPTGAGPVRLRYTTRGWNVFGSVRLPTNWSQIPVHRADGPTRFQDQTSTPWLWSQGLRGAYWFDEVVPFGASCVYAQDPRAASDRLDASSIPIGCVGHGSSDISGLRTARIDTVRLSTWGPPLQQDLIVTGTMTDPWVAPGEPGPVLRVRVEGSGESVLVRARPRPDLVGPMPDLSGAFDFVATVPRVSQGIKRICLYDRSTTHPPQWSDWMWPPDATLDCRDGMPVPSSAPSPAVGFLDTVTVDGRRVTMTGWALDRDGGTPRVLLSSNGRLIALTTPSLPRPDVRREYGGDGRAGFSTSVELPPGSHLICPAFGDTTYPDRWGGGPCASVVVK